jgi:hypothetical protein
LQMLAAIMQGKWRNTRAIRSARMKPATTSFVRGSPRAARIASEQFSEFQTPRQQLQDAMTTVQIRARIFWTINYFRVKPQREDAQVPRGMDN